MNSKVILIIGLLGFSSILFQNFTTFEDEPLTESTIQISDQQVFRRSRIDLNDETKYYRKESTSVALAENENFERPKIENSNMKIKLKKVKNKRTVANSKNN